MALSRQTTTQLLNNNSLINFLNKGKTKVYSGVSGNLVAFACKFSFQRGHKGNVSFLSKSQLVEHYEKTLGAFHFGGRVMIIETRAALKLINKYFQNQ